MSRTNLLYSWTKDNLRLPGVHYKPEEIKDVCIIGVHGMSGNILENYFADVLGNMLAKNGIGFIYGHNRGYNHINDITTKEVGEDEGYKTTRIGVTYERFEACVIDIETWIDETRKQGYKKIILLGHSLGCNKVIYYLHKNSPEDAIGVILASPPDMVGQFKKYQSNYTELVEEAKKNLAENQPHKILSTLIWEWYNLSSQTFLDIAVDGCPADNLPIMRNPDTFPELSSIKLPILSIMGKHDDIAINTLEEDMNLIAKKATNCPEFTKKCIDRANHTYSRQEESFANTVLEWVKGLSN